MTHRFGPWVETVILAFARLSLGAGLQATGTLAPYIRQDLLLTNADIGSLASAYTAAGIVLALPAALIVLRLGDRTSSILGTSLLAMAALASAWAPSVSFLMAARLAGGIGAVLISVAMPKRVADSFSQRDSALALTMLMASFPIGMVASLSGLPAVADAWGWRSAFVVLAGFGLLGSFACLALNADAPRTKGRFRRPSARIVAVILATGTLWAAFNAGLVSVLAFGPSLLVDLGRSPVSGSLIVAATMLGHLLGMSLGALIERRVSGTVLCAFSFAALATAIQAVPSTAGAAAAFCAVGLFAALPVGSAAALPFRYLAPEHRAIGMGWYHTAHYAGLAILPPLAGVSADRAGAVGEAFEMAAVFPLLSLLILVLLPRPAHGGREQRQAEDPKNNNCKT